MLGSGNTLIMPISHPQEVFIQRQDTVLNKPLWPQNKSPSSSSNQILNFLYKNSRATVGAGEQEGCKFEVWSEHS